MPGDKPLFGDVHLGNGKFKQQRPPTAKAAPGPSHRTYSFSPGAPKLHLAVQLSQVWKSFGVTSHSRLRHWTSFSSCKTGLSSDYLWLGLITVNQARQQWTKERSQGGGEMKRAKADRPCHSELDNLLRDATESSVTPNNCFQDSNTSKKARNFH